METRETGSEGSGAMHCSTLFDWAQSLSRSADHYTLDDIIKADAIVDAWCGEHHCDDFEPVDSTWLTTVGGVEETPLIFGFSGILLLSCDCGQWVAYLRGSVYHHKLVEVMSRREVRLLLQALKLNA